MRRSFQSTLLVAALSFGLVKPAFATEATYLQVSRIGDTQLSCGQLSQEAILMRDIIGATEEIKDDAELQNYEISAAGAVGSLLISSATGGLGLAAVGYLLQQNSEDKGDEADAVRRSLMVGIYNAKGCSGPIEHAFYLPDSDDVGLRGQTVQISAVAPSAGGSSEYSNHRTRSYNE